MMKAGELLLKETAIVVICAIAGVMERIRDQYIWHFYDRGDQNQTIYG